MTKPMNALVLTLLFLGFGFAGTGLAAKQPCREGDLQRPQLPQSVEIDLELLRGTEGQESLPEWSKIEKLRNFFKVWAEGQAPCLLVEGGDIVVQLFIDRASFLREREPIFAGQFKPEDSLQFYGASRVKVERSDQQVTREYAYPVDGPSAMSAIVETEEMPVLMEDLAQVKMVRVPRIKRRSVPGPGGQPSQDCFLLSSATLVPSRVFDPGMEQDLAPDTFPLSLEARRTTLEQVAGDVQWLERFETEVPGCSTPEGDGFWGRQVTSLNLTVKELVPDLDFLTQSIRFWREIESRVQQLREEEEGWKKEIGAITTPGIQAGQARGASR